MARRAGVKLLDVFIIANAAVFIATTLYTYKTDQPEFGVYALVLLTAGLFFWRFLRRFDFPAWLLGLMQVGILIHFAGGLVRPGPDRLWLYWHYILGVRYDQYVHFFNSMVVVLVLAFIVDGMGIQLGRMRPFILVFVTLGIGGFIEIVEYFAILTIPDAGVGDYANNMMDLVMNISGGTTGVLLMALASRLRARRGRPRGPDGASYA